MPKRQGMSGPLRRLAVPQSSLTTASGLIVSCAAHANTPQACRSDSHYEILTKYPSPDGEPVWFPYCARHLTWGIRAWAVADGVTELTIRLAWALRVHLEVNPHARDEVTMPNGQAFKPAVPECQHRRNGVRDCPKEATVGDLCAGHAHELAASYGLENVLVVTPEPEPPRPEPEPEPPRPLIKRVPLEEFNALAIPRRGPGRPRKVHPDIRL